MLLLLLLLLLLLMMMMMLLLMMMMMKMVVVAERGRMLGWLVSCGARPVKMIGLLTAGDTDSNHTLHILRVGL